MTIQNSRLMNQVLVDMTPWILPIFQEALKSDADENNYDLKILKEISENDLSPKQQYEKSVYWWCRKLIQSIERLNVVVNMVGHSVHTRKKEDKIRVLKEWFDYHYEYYVLVFQGITDLSALLTNAVIDVGIPVDKCTYGGIVSNTRIKSYKLDKPLKDLNLICDKYHVDKNSCLHRGERIEAPHGLNLTDIATLADAFSKSSPASYPGNLKELVAQFYADKARKNLPKKMKIDLIIIEHAIQDLMDQLFPFYEKAHSSFS